jgi:sirohydrochlorin ferrochelatase
VALERLSWLVSRTRELSLQGNREHLALSREDRETRGQGDKGTKSIQNSKFKIQNLPLASCQLPITHYQLPITNYPLPIQNHASCFKSAKPPNALAPKSKIQNSLTPYIGTACLELSPTPLHQQIAEFSDRALSCGYQRVQIVPLFLLPGIHVMEDIPAQVELARQALGTKVKLELRPHLGSHAGLVRLLAQQLHRIEAETAILLAHGSRRAGSGHPVETIAQQLDAVAAYWSVVPSLGERVQELAVAGQRRIAIVPYFLFAGGITDAIAEVVGQLQAQFPALELCLMEPLGATQELADLIWDLIEI